MSAKDTRGKGQAKHELDTAVESEQEVVAYLRSEPDFFVRQASLLEDLRVPHRCGGAVSLVEHQVAVLREQTRQLRAKLQELIDNARRNEALNQRLHQLTLRLLECALVEDVFATLYQALSEDFEADMVTIRVSVPPASQAESGLAEFVNDDGELTSLFHQLFETRRPVCGRLSEAQLQYLFSERGAELGSGALVPLGAPRALGMLAIGSRDVGRFYDGMGTTLLNNLGEITGRVLVPYLACD